MPKSFLMEGYGKWENWNGAATDGLLINSDDSLQPTEQEGQKIVDSSGSFLADKQCWQIEITQVLGCKKNPG